MTLPPPQRAAFGYYCTARLSAVFYGLCRVVCSRAAGENDCGEVLMLSRLIGRAAKLMCGAQRFNARLGLRRAMLASPVWRARVRRELGGGIAMGRWERGYLSAKARKAQREQAGFEPQGLEQCNGAPDRAGNRANKNAKNNIWASARTDFEGQFRLAIIERPKLSERSKQSGRTERSGRSGLDVNAVTARTPRGAGDAIAVYPSELCAVKAHEAGVYSGNDYRVYKGADYGWGEPDSYEAYAPLRAPP